MSSIHGAIRLEPGQRGLGWSFAGQPLPGQEADRCGQRNFLGRSRPGDRIHPDARFDKIAQVGADPIHRFGAKRFDPRCFQRIEHRPGIAVRYGRTHGMQLGVVVAQSQRQRIGRAARLRHQPGLQTWPRGYDAGDLAGGLAAGVRCEHHVGLRIARNRPHRPREDGPETVEGSRNRHLPMML